MSNSELRDILKNLSPEDFDAIVRPETKRRDDEIEEERLKSLTPYFAYESEKYESNWEDSEHQFKALYLKANGSARETLISACSRPKGYNQYDLLVFQAILDKWTDQTLDPPVSNLADHDNEMIFTKILSFKHINDDLDGWEDTQYNSHGNLSAPRVYNFETKDF
jgi:hypothetical protein